MIRNFWVKWKKNSKLVKDLAAGIKVPTEVVTIKDVVVVRENDINIICIVKVDFSKVG